MRRSLKVGKRFEAAPRMASGAAAAIALALTCGSANAQSQPAQPAPLPALPTTEAAATDEAPAVIIVQEEPAPATGAPAAGAVIAERPAVDMKPRKLKEEWYGYQNLIIDGAATAMIFGPLLLDRGKPEGSIMLAGALTYIGGGPVVHWLHGNVGPGFGSFAFRVGLPVTGAFWGAIGGAMLMSRNASHGFETGAAVGFFAGMAGASLLDAGLLAYEKGKDPEAYDGDAAKAKPKSPPRGVGMRLVPQAAVLPGGGSVGVGGVFF
jgi:hypothetical protein